MIFETPSMNATTALWLPCWAYRPGCFARGRPRMSTAAAPGSAPALRRSCPPIGKLLAFDFGAKRTGGRGYAVAAPGTPLPTFARRGQRAALAAGRCLHCQLAA